MNGKPKNVRKSYYEKEHSCFCCSAHNPRLRFSVYSFNPETSSQPLHIQRWFIWARAYHLFGWFTVQGCHIEDIQPFPRKITRCPTVNCLGCQNQTPHVHLLCAPAVLEVPRRSQATKNKVQFNHKFYITTPKKNTDQKNSKGPPPGQTTQNSHFEGQTLGEYEKIQQFSPPQKKWWKPGTMLTSWKSKVFHPLPGSPHFPGGPFLPCGF